MSETLHLFGNEEQVAITVTANTVTK